MRCPRRAASWWTASRARCRRWAACSMACSTSRGWTRAWCVRRCSRWRSPTCSIACSEFAPQAQAKSLRLRCAARGHGLVGPGAAGPHPAQPDPQRHPSHRARRRAGRLPPRRRRAARGGLGQRRAFPCRTGTRLLGIPSAGQPRTRPQQGPGLGLASQRTARLLGHPLACAPGRARHRVQPDAAAGRSPGAAPAQADEPQPAALPTHAASRWCWSSKTTSKAASACNCCWKGGATACWRPAASMSCCCRPRRTWTASR